MTSPTLLALLETVTGLILLTAGAEALVRGAGSLARRLGIPALVVGLTVVAFGTSAPEVAVSVEAAVGGRGDVALGNVVGSNIFNVLFILGLSALITPLAVKRQLVRYDVPVMVGVSLLPLLLGLDGLISRGEGIFLLAVLALYLANLGRLALKNPEDSGDDGGARQGAWPLSVLLAVAGLTGLVYGASLLVDGATTVARAAGVSELVIGLTLVAAGTSLPEMATSVIASLRGERDLAVGNVVGSNIFNLLAVLGIASVAANAGLPVPAGVRTFDLPVMVAVGAACLPVFWTGARISRREGAVFLLYYVLYLVYLALHVTDHEYQDEFGLVVLGVVLPLTIALAGAIWVRGREWRLPPEDAGKSSRGLGADQGDSGR